MIDCRRADDDYCHATDQEAGIARIRSRGNEAIFTKLKQTQATAVLLSAPGLPPGSTLHKVYATSSGGARRLLFFCRHQTATATERWVLLFYRRKGDEIGDNMSAKNPRFTPALLKNLQLAVDDIANSTAVEPQFEEY